MAPLNQSVEITLTARFIATVKGTGQFTYQWHKGNHKMDNETHSTLVIANASLKNQDYYSCHVTNENMDSTHSNKAFLHVTSE